MTRGGNGSWCSGMKSHGPSVWQDFRTHWPTTSTVRGDTWSRQRGKGQRMEDETPGQAREDSRKTRPQRRNTIGNRHHEPGVVCIMSYYNNRRSGTLYANASTVSMEDDMALELNRGHTALLLMDFENDIVHEEGAFKDFGFAQMVKDNDVLGKTAQPSCQRSQRRDPRDIRFCEIPARLPGAPGQRGSLAGTARSQRAGRGNVGRVDPRRRDPAGWRGSGNENGGVSAFMASDLEPITQEQAHRDAAAGRGCHQLSWSRARRERPATVATTWSSSGTVAPQLTRRRTTRH